jgi:hypothetical protein
MVKVDQFKAGFKIGKDGASRIVTATILLDEYVDSDDLGDIKLLETL